MFMKLNPVRNFQPLRDAGEMTELPLADGNNR